MFDPEAIEVALFELIKSAVKTQNLTFQTVSRHARIGPNTDIAGQPALYLIPLGGAESQSQNNFNLQVHLTSYVVFVQWRSQDPTPNPLELPQTFGNKVWKAIADILGGSPPAEPQTLGGLVTNVWIEGQVLMQAGILDEQCSIEIPISALTGR